MAVRNSDSPEDFWSKVLSAAKVRRILRLHAGLE